MQSVCTKWSDLGLELLDAKDGGKISIIETNSKTHGVQKCCMEMFQEWLNYGTDVANWDTLVKAIEKIGLKYVADQTEKLLKSGDIHKGMIIYCLFYSSSDYIYRISYTGFLWYNFMCMHCRYGVTGCLGAVAIIFIGYV